MSKISYTAFLLFFVVCVTAIQGVPRMYDNNAMAMDDSAIAADSNEDQEAVAPLLP